MKTVSRPSVSLCTRLNPTLANQRAYWTAIWLVSLACGSVATAQTNTPTATTNAPVSATSTNVTKLQETTVVGQLDVARNQIMPDLGATVHTVSKDQIQAEAQGENASFNQLILRTPGVAEDSLGQLHIRGEHANLQYRINDVLLPEGITGFGPELSPRFADSVSLITGALPAQYGFRTAGIVDIHTKSGVFEPGGEAGMYGGSYDTLNPSFEYGGSQGKAIYYMDGSYSHNGIGIENPTDSSVPIHDTTDQYKAFGYWSYLLDDTSRISLMTSASYSDFEVPNTPGQGQGGGTDNANAPFVWPVPGVPNGSFNSVDLNERQNEQNYYAVVAYQKSAGDFNMQIAGFGRDSSVHFMPDQLGDLYFNGVASDVKRSLYSGGLQLDASYAVGEAHTIRGGLSYLGEQTVANSSTTVFPLDANGDPTLGTRTIDDRTAVNGSFYGFYLQDEWKMADWFTLNYGARFDLFSSYISENQLSPRINAIITPTDSTTLHLGYARYFTPPPLEVVQNGTVTQFDGTSNASATDRNDPVKSERSHYFDAGVTQKILPVPGLQVGVDGYYKIAKNQLDDGLFGQTLILSPFNYDRGTVEGVEATGSYTKGGFTSYANFAVSKAQGDNINSAQFLFDPAVVAYSQHSSIYLDHDQTLTGSFGASYLWKQERGSTLFYSDLLFGSGLREDSVDSAGNLTVPNGSRVPAYYSLNLGVQHTFKINNKDRIKARFDIVNVTDDIFQLRNGTGVGVNAAQYGERRGFFGGVSFIF